MTGPRVRRLTPRLTPLLAPGVFNSMFWPLRSPQAPPASPVMFTFCVGHLYARIKPLAVSHAAPLISQ